MKKRILLLVWMQRLPILCAAIVAFSSTAFGQANFWSVYGDPACTTCCNQSVRFNCNATPAASSVAPISNLSDGYATSGTGSISTSTLYQTSMFSDGGQLLFTANQNGIFDPSGTMQCDFRMLSAGSPFTFTSAGGSTYYLEPTYAISEINIFPYPGACNSYYVLFWAQNRAGTIAMIRCIKVDIDIRTNALTFTDNVIFDVSEGCTYIGSGSFSSSGFPLLLKADALAGSGTRDFYTLNFNYAYPSRNDGATLSTMRKWTISSTGSLPSSSTSYPSIKAAAGYTLFNRFQSNPYGSIAKLITIGGVKYFCYVAGDEGQVYSFFSAHGYFLEMLDVNTGVKIPASLGFATNFGAAPGGGLLSSVQIYGFEYVPSQNVIYCSYTDYSASSSYAGIAYWSGGRIYQSFYPTSEYRNTDLQLDKNGDLLMVGNPLFASYYSGTTEGRLAYLPVSSGAASIYAVPTVINVPGCSTHPTVSVLNNVAASRVSGDFGYYLGSQITGDPYTNGTNMINYTVSGSETWTPTNNPVANATGTPTSTISFLGDVTIPAGTSLHTQNMTLKFATGNHVFVEASAASGATLGGKFTLDNSTLTRDNTGCQSSQSWGGVVLKGDVAQAQLNFATTHQGALNMINNSYISYADVGVQCGWGTGVIGYRWVPYGSHYIVRPIFGPLGGGLANISWGNLFNNVIGVNLPAYRNYNPTTHYEINNANTFYGCVFASNDPAITATAASSGVPVIGINGYNVRGIGIYGCKFSNSTGNMQNTYGIYADNMGFTADQAPSPGHCKFTNLMEGIKHMSSINTNTATIKNCDFNNNALGVELTGTQAPLLYGNTFNVLNHYGGPGFYTYFSAPGTSGIGVATIGLLMNGTSSYVVNGNTFNGATYSGSNTTVGVVVYKGGGSNELINNNTYNTLFAANLSNFKNTNSYFYSHTGTGPTGLQFTCNLHTYNTYDISSRGFNYSNDGICSYQGNSGLAAGNYFSSTGTGHTYNLYNPGPTTSTTPHNEVGQVYYWYAHPVGGSGTYHPEEAPGQPSASTAYNYGAAYSSTDLLVTGIDATDHCLTSTGADGSHVVNTTMEGGGSGAAQRLLAVKNNVNYYMNDPVAMVQRDSLYYWAREIQTPAGDRLLSALFLEDSLIDSANVVYNRISSKYGLDQQETDEFDIYGRQLMDLQISKMKNIGESLSIDEVLTLENIYATAPVWAKAIAKNWLQSFVSVDALDPGFTIVDTLLLPVPPDSSAAKSIGQASGYPDTKIARIFPNPATSTIQVQYDLAPGATATIRISDISGREVIRQNLNEHLTELNVMGLESGLYLYEILEGSSIKLQGKITKY